MDWFRYSVLKRASIGCTVLVVGCLLNAARSNAYPTPVDFSGKLARWNIDPASPKIYYEVVADDAFNLHSYKDLVREAAGIWSSVHGSYAELELADTGETAMVSVHYDYSITGGDSSAGYAEFDAVDDHGPTHCVIHIAAPLGMDWEALGKTTLHELGHCLGLGHSVVPESIMSYRLDVNSFSLALDDEAAVARLYPASGSEPKKPAGCTVGSAHTQAGKVLLFLVLLPLVSLGLRRRFLR